MNVPNLVIRPQTPTTQWQASTELPTRFGLFNTHVFRTAEPGDGALFKEHVALAFGDIRRSPGLLIRIHLVPDVKFILPVTTITSPHSPRWTAAAR